MFNLPLNSILLLPLLVLGPLFPVLPIPTSLSMRLAIGLVLLSTFFAWLAKRAGLGKAVISAFLFAISLCLVPIVVKGYDTFLLTVILSGLLGFLAFEYFKSPVLLLGVILLLCLYFAFYFLQEGNLDSAFYIETETETVGASRNFVGVVLLQYYLIYYAVCIRNQIKPYHWPLFLMPMFCIMSAGVSSTLVATALMFGFLLLKLKIKLIHGILGLMFIALVGFVASRWIETTLLFERLTTGDFVFSRLLLWSDFFSKLDMQSLLVGFSRDASFIDHPVNLEGIHNLHNSYLNLYKTIGICSFFYYLLVGYVAFALFKVNKVLCIIFIASLFRAATDGYYFASFLVDFIIFYLFILTPLGERIVMRASNLRQGAGKQKHIHVAS